jgi:hypothetical protein
MKKWLTENEIMQGQWKSIKIPQEREREIEREESGEERGIERTEYRGGGTQNGKATEDRDWAGDRKWERGY